MSARVALLTIGTRGDVFPFLSLGFALAEAGYQPRLLVPARFAPLAAKLSLPATEVALDPEALLAEPETSRLVRRGVRLRVLVRLQKLLSGEARTLDDLCERAVRGADLIVAHSLLGGRGLALSEAARVPLVIGHAAPMAPTRTLLPPLLPRSATGSGAVNRLTHRLVERLYWRVERGPLNAFRKRLGLAPQREATERAAERRGDPALYFFSPSLVPPPPDWSPRHRITGAWIAPPAMRARLGEQHGPPAFAAWLAEGSPPVFIGFGSMAVHERAELVAIAGAARDALGVRVVLGGGEAGPLGPDLWGVGAVDHDWLFPRCAAVVHHGGAGTAATVTRSGVPSVVCPLLADQFFWADRVVRLGIGVRVRGAPLRQKALLAGIAAALRPEVREAARAVGARAAEEEGLAGAVQVIEEAAARSR